MSTTFAARLNRLFDTVYPPGRGPQDAVNIKSASKSLLSALVGIAVADGSLAGLDRRLADLLPDGLATASDPRARQITVRHLLTMTVRGKRLAAPWVQHPGSRIARNPVMAEALDNNEEKVMAEIRKALDAFIASVVKAA